MFGNVCARSNVEHWTRLQTKHWTLNIFLGAFFQMFFITRSQIEKPWKKNFTVFQVFSRFFKIRKTCDENFQVFLTPFSTMTKKNRNSAKKKKHICCSFCLKNTTRIVESMPANSWILIGVLVFKRMFSHYKNAYKKAVLDSCFTNPKCIMLTRVKIQFKSWFWVGVLAIKKRYVFSL